MERNIKNNNSIKGILLLLSSALLYSIMPVLIRLLGGGGIPPMSQVFLRYIFAFLAASTYFFVVSKAKIKIAKKDIFWLLVASGFGYALTNLFFTYGILYTKVSNALFLFNSYAIITPILGFIFLKEKINKVNVLSLCIIFIALVILYQPNGITTWRIGGFFAILTALGQSVYLILRKKLKNYSAGFMLLANTLIGVILLGLLSLIIENSFYFQGGVAHISSKTWLATVLFGIDNFLAWLVMTKGFEYLKVTTGSIILLSELVFGILFAAVFFLELPTFTALVGGILIITSSILVILKGESQN